MHTVVLAIISTIFILAGLVGAILPFIPGVFTAWLGLFIFAIGTGFGRISIATTVIFFGVMLLTLAFDIAAPILAARKLKTSQWGTLGGSVGSMVGKIALGPGGMIFGPFLGTILGELIDRWKHGQSVKIALGLILGLIAGILVKIIVVLVMFGFLIAAWF